MFSHGLSRGRRALVLAALVSAIVASMFAVSLSAPPTASAAVRTIVTCHNVLLRETPGGYAERSLSYGDEFWVTALQSGGYTPGVNAREGYGWVLSSCLTYVP